jgi:hypothetical protein
VLLSGAASAVAAAATSTGGLRTPSGGTQGSIASAAFSAGA